MVTFNTDMKAPLKKLKVSVEPVQDLHGYDHPWPAGGGKNKFTTVGEEVGKYINVDGNVGSNAGWILSDYIPVAPSTQYTFTPNSTSGDSAHHCYFDSNKGFLSSIPSGQQTFTTPSDCAFMRFSYRGNGSSYDIQLELGSTATTWTPYENICPISGWTEANVQRTGINIWDEQWEVGTIDNTTGVPSGDSKNIRSLNFISCVPNTAYYFYSGSNKPLRLHWYDATYSYIGSEVINNAVRTTPSNAVWFKVRSTTEYGRTYLNDISINYPSTDTAYHPGHAQTVHIAFPSSAGIVYGCKLTVNEDGTGELVVDRVCQTYNGTENITYNATYRYMSIPASYPHTIPQTPVGFLSSMYIFTNNYIVPRLALSNGANMFWLWLDPADQYYGDANAFKTMLASCYEAGNPLQILYYLATPLTYTLTAEQISGILTTLKDTNNVWSDAGQVELSYWTHTPSTVKTTLVRRNYSPNGASWSDTSAINLSAGDFIEAKIDLNGCTGSSENILSIGSIIDTWAIGSSPNHTAGTEDAVVHLYYPKNGALALDVSYTIIADGKEEKH